MTTEPADEPRPPSAVPGFSLITHQLSDLGPRPGPPRPLPRGFLFRFGPEVPTARIDDRRRDAADDTGTP